LLPIRSAVYFQQPETVGVRLLGAFASERSITVRWAQLPHVYGPGHPAPWILPASVVPEVQLADSLNSPYVPAVQQAGAGGQWDPPFWRGETTFITDETVQPGLREATIGERSAQFHLAS
jgi:hypothetical protein